MSTTLPNATTDSRGARALKAVRRNYCSENVNLHLDPGEVLGVVGDNGANKSTLMKILSGLYQPSEG
jgi:simple sugar transport system ATP-binding protein